MDKKQFANDLITWYENNHRDLPWRKTTNPYFIWLSEIMLQQTQVQTVIPYYNRFIETFPTINDLANANLEDVYKCWEGLGYYSRARNLQIAAQQVMEDFQGAFPNTYETLLKLKGVGPYTAAAVASIAFAKPKGVVDGNVLRILARVYEKEDNIALSKTRNTFQILCDELIDPLQPSFFNQGLMDLGATICKPQKPLCECCPIAKHCISYHNHKQNLLPVNIKKVNRLQTGFITCIIEFQHHYFLYKNEKGLLTNLYALPQYETESPHAFEEQFKEEYHEEIEIYEFIKDVSHTFTHRTWKMHVYLARFIRKPQLPLYDKKEMEKLAISTAHKKVLNLIEMSI